MGVLLPEDTVLMAPPPQVKELQAVMAAAAEQLAPVGADGQRRHLLLARQLKHTAHRPEGQQTPGSVDQLQWGEGLEPAGEGLPAVPDPDGAVVVATDDAALTADQVAAGRDHLHHLYTWRRGRGKRSGVSQRSGGGSVRGQLSIVGQGLVRGQSKDRHQSQVPVRGQVSIIVKVLIRGQVFLKGQVLV